MESSSSKRPRAQTQVPSCLVDGCSADLSKCRDYHRRHKVCETHSKSPKVAISGQEMRFCQQCSRFHPKVEFDEGKRSCRKRLDDHNRRRRKPQPVFLPLNSGSILSNHHGIRSLSFINPNIVLCSNLSSSYRPASMMAETEAAIQLNFAEDRRVFVGSTSLDYNTAGKQFPFLQETCSSIPQPHLLGLNSSSVLNRMVGPNSALSLLSSQATETWEVGDSHIAQSDSFKNSSSDTLLGTGGGDDPNQQGQYAFGIKQESDCNQGISFPWE